MRAWLSVAAHVGLFKCALAPLDLQADCTDYIWSDGTPFSAAVGGNDLAFAPFKATGLTIRDAVSGRALKFDRGASRIRLDSGEDITFDILSPARSDSTRDYSSSEYVALKHSDEDTYFRHAGFVTHMHSWATYVSQTVSGNLAYDFAWRFIDQGDGTFKIFNDYGGGWWLGHNANDEILIVNSGEAGAMRFTIDEVYPVPISFGGEDAFALRMVQEDIATGSGAYWGLCERDSDAVPGSCTEEEASTCHQLGYCVNGACECPPGTRDVDGDGTDCATTGFAVRFVLADHIDDDDLASRRASNPSLFTNADVMGVYCHGGAEGWFLEHVDTNLTSTVAYTAVWCIYDSSGAATAALTLYSASTYAGQTVTAGPRVYAWTLPTTSAPLFVAPTGMEVDSVHFDTSCAESGCWVVNGVLTTGQKLWENNAFSTLFLPHAVGSDALSYDYDYSAGGNGVSNDVPVEWTFAPVNHPCTSVNFDASGGNTQEVTTCCITNPGVGESGGASGSKGGFLANYRPTVAFAGWAAAELAVCSGAEGEVVEMPGTAGAEVPFPVNPAYMLLGQFTGMSDSPGVVKLNNTDPFFGQYEFTIELDEVELRGQAGKLVGTVGVEHSVDTFVGYSNFRTTGLEALDTFSTQIAIHLEKTSFFTVSTEGVNQYTFLEYVNLRLVAVYEEDADFSGTDESSARTVRTDAQNQANYIQVTFTLGSQYAVDAREQAAPGTFPLIPRSSVRAGHGTFFEGAALLHMCELYAADDVRFDATSGSLDFESLLSQPCAPAASMCASPSSIPDSFVVYNIPLGVDYFGGEAGGPSPSLSNNIFVDMVISAVEDTDTTPNDGEDPMQMKTTLTASIPIVEGGVNIFCDGFTAKTDLEDVADADIVVGSASDASELSRLRILSNIASTQLDPNEITQIDSDSIEAGLMTLVLKGNASYFGLGGRSAVSVELEDVVTIHIMEDSGSGVGTGKDAFVLGKLSEAPADNDDGSGLITDGYCLNGAFCFEVDRASQRAHLEPTAALLAECPFNPPRPDPSLSPLETCVTRRDVRYREFPARTGAFSTAMELCSGGKGSCGAMADEQWFFTTIFGNNDYAKSLATSYANVIADHYDLNGVFRRAYWINPGYEWTPTQTGGTPIFSVSQKLYLFALITLDEGLTDPSTPGASLSYASPVLPGSRRRMLLQSTPSTADEKLQDGQSEVGGGVFEFETTPAMMMAKAFEVPLERVATFAVQLQLTQAEACMSTTQLQASLRHTLADHLTAVASPTHTVQVLAMSVDKGGVQCGRRSIRALLSSWSDASAEVTMMVVFKEDTEATISLAQLQSMAGIQAVQPLSVSATVNTAADHTYVPPRDTATPEGESSGSSKTALIAGAAGGAVGALCLVVGGILLYLRRSKAPEVVQAVQSIQVQDLKAQLANDV